MTALEGYVPGRYKIDDYGNGGFRFADMSHRGSILALPTGVRAAVRTYNLLIDEGRRVGALLIAV
jgi:uncharacterized protein